MKTNTIRFSNIDKTKFFRTLNKKVNAYFKENNIKKTGNYKLFFKAFLMFALFLIPLIFLFTVDNLSGWTQAL